MTIVLRPSAAEDRDFLFQVYASTRREEMALVDWTPDQIQAFLTMQFNAQDKYYHEHYAGTEFLVVMMDGTAVGRYYLYRSEFEFILMDIALLPEYRGHGIGTQLLRELLDEARARQLPVHLHVEPFNRARDLYERFGFQTLEERGVYNYMEWRAS